MKIRKSVKFAFLALILAIICCGIFIFFQRITPKRIPSNRLPLQVIKFETDGYITKKFLIKALAIKKDAIFSDIDIFALKKKLLSITQIKDAYIERQFPASIFIKIKERSPLLKFAIKSENKVELLFVDKEDGSIFRGSCLPKKVILSTPYVELNLEKTTTNKIGYKPITGISHVKQLIQLLRNEYPYIYEDINKFSLLRYDSREKASWSRIEIYQKSGRVIVFNPNKLEIQLLNLDYLLNEKHFPRENVQKIDLSRIESAIIETR
ncbi:MAG: FtsQ-type POTRA domain-containing protein [Opitutales bacterium]|nr:FtsQ-type POTRA domain-containing protein [Opitutales bacterium]